MNILNCKYFVVFFVVLLVFTSTGFPILAATTDLNQGQIPDSTTYKAPQQAQYISENLLHSILCLIIGQSLIQGVLCGGTTSSGFKLFSQVPGGGALGMTNSAMMSMYIQPPTSTTFYIANVGSHLGISSVYAQTPSVPGSGSSVVSVVLNLWEVARNISYLLFILIFVVVGIMIMFRHKINPQTVVTIQMALPRLVIGLILVTFSYLIASFIVDISFVGAGFVGLFFTTAFPNNGDFTLANGGVLSVASAGNIPGIFSLFFLRTAVLGNTLGGFVELFSGWVPSVIPQSQGSLGILNFIISTVLAPVGGLLGGVVGLLVAVIVVVAALIQCLRLTWALLQAYISILIFTVIGPFIILFSSLPGQEKALGFWWKNILGNVLIFPAVFAAFLFAAAILDNVNSTNGYSAAAMPLFGGIDTSLLRGLLALGIVLGTPAIPKMVRQAVGAGGLGAIGAAAGQGFGAAATLGGIYAGPQIGPAAARYGPAVGQFFRNIRGLPPTREVTGGPR